MASSSDEQDFTDLFLGDDSTTFPTYPQQIPLPPFDPAVSIMLHVLYQIIEANAVPRA